MSCGYRYWVGRERRGVWSGTVGQSRRGHESTSLAASCGRVWTAPAVRWPHGRARPCERQAGTERLGVFGENKSNLGAFCTHSLVVAVMARRRGGKAGPAYRAVSLGVLEVCKSPLVLYCIAATAVELCSHHTVATIAAISIRPPSTQNHRRDHCPPLAFPQLPSQPLSRLSPSNGRRGERKR